MAKDAIDFSRPVDELFSEGSVFVAGKYEVLKSGFTFFDFGKAGNDSLCFMMELKPVDGEPLDRPRYWPVGGKLKDGTILVEPCNPVKGEKGLWSSIRFTENNKNDKLHKGQDFAIFVDHCHKAELDMDAISNDFTSFADNVYEFGLFTVKHEKKGTAISEAEGDNDNKPKRESHDVPVIVAAAKKAKGGSKPATKEKKEEEEETPAKKPAKKAKGPVGIISNYIEENIVPEVENDGEAGWLDHRLALSKHLTKDLRLNADDAGVVMEIYNNKDEDEGIPSVLESFGLKLNADKQIVKAKSKK